MCILKCYVTISWVDLVLLVLLCYNIVIFRPHKWGRKIMICVAFFLQILPNLHFYLLYLVKR